MASPEYRHERLKLSGRFMRLIQIQGGAKNSVLSLRITQYALHRRPAFVAISYTWGSPGDARELRVNGRPFKVRVNLWNLLSHLRQRGESRFLWIDALCIDQQNLEERSFHVNMMAEIYEQAEMAIVWLGLPSEDRRQARSMEFVAEMADFAKKHSQLLAKFRDTYLVDSCGSRWVNLLELCRGTYFGRTWIIQEFLQARTVEVLCGTAKLDWKHFEDVVLTLRQIQLSNPTPASTFPTLVFALVAQFMHTLPVRLTTRRLAHTESTLEELLSEFYDSKCTERRDKIYGILGIADDCGEDASTGIVRGPQPDYAKHILEVYFEMYEYLRTVRGKLNLQTIFLAQKALGISQADIASYMTWISGQKQQQIDATMVGAPLLRARLSELACPLVPDYVNVIEEVLPGWTSLRDLRQRLEQVDWTRYVGHEVVRKTSRPGSGSRPVSNVTLPSQRKQSFNKSMPSPGSAQGLSYVRAPLPGDLLDNVLYAAEHSSMINNLCNYPSCTSGLIPLEHALLHAEDKRIMNETNPTPNYSQGVLLRKPSVIIETSPERGIEPARLGFACSDVRAGDMICQFHGVDTTIIVRKVTGGVRVVGRAVMVTHERLQERGLHPACRSTRQPELARRKEWSGVVSPKDEDGSTRSGASIHESCEIITDPISLWEILRRG